MSVQSIALDNIARYSEWVRNDAESVARYVRVLQSLPEFETLAEDEIAKAETALTEALLAVKLARSELKNKRVKHLVAAE